MNIHRSACAICGSAQDICVEFVSSDGSVRFHVCVDCVVHAMKSLGANGAFGDREVRIRTLDQAAELARSRSASWGPRWRRAGLLIAEAILALKNE